MTGIPSNLEFSSSMQTTKESEKDNLPASTSTSASASAPSTASGESRPATVQREARVTGGRVSSGQAAQKKDAPAPVVPLRSDANSALVRIVDALPESQRKKEVERLNALNAMELSWENSDATMKALDGGLPSKPRVRPTPKARGPNAGRRTDITSHPPSQSESESEPQAPTSPHSTPPSSGVDEGQGSSSSSASASTPSVTLSANRVNEPESSPRPVSDIPEWIEDHRDRLSEVPMLDELQATWARVIRNWILLEESQGYQTPQKGFPVPGRPREISTWIQNARSGNSNIASDRHNGFSREFLGWWNRVNPTWRTRQNDRLVIGGTGDWNELLRPGKCGFLLILECLRALYTTATVEEFTYALTDVDWAMTQVLLAQARRYVCLLFCCEAPCIDSLITDRSNQLLIVARKTKGEQRLVQGASIIKYVYHSVLTGPHSGENDVLAQRATRIHPRRARRLRLPLVTNALAVADDDALASCSHSMPRCPVVINLLVEQFRLVKRLSVLLWPVHMSVRLSAPLISWSVIAYVYTLPYFLDF